jgi:hypothetical protein
MKLILNDKLTKSENIREYPLGDIIRSNMTKVLKPDEKYQFFYEFPQTKLRNAGLLGFLSHAYSNHVNVSISPYDIWILIISEVSKFIVDKPEPFRELFTDSTEKKEILVPTNSEYEMPMDLLSEALSKSINFDASILFPELSIESEESVGMIQALFCEMASPYYSYSMFMCGLPEIKVLGTVDDWKNIRTNFDKLFELLGKCYNFKNYPVRVKIILDNIVNSFEASEADRISFWKDIFTQKNVGSGSQLEVDGWITHFLIVQKKPLKLENFTNTIGYVRYKNLTSGNNYMSIHGGFDYDLDEEEFACLRYSKYISIKC